MKILHIPTGELCCLVPIRDNCWIIVSINDNWMSVDMEITEQRWKYLWNERKISLISLKNTKSYNLEHLNQEDLQDFIVEFELV